MWLGPTLPLIVAGVAAIVAWRRQTRRLHRRALHEPWNADMCGEDHRQGVFGRRKRHRWSATVLSALAGSLAATVVLHVIQVAALARGG